MWTQLGNARYRGIEGAPAVVQLKNGHWSGRPFEPGSASRPRVWLLDDLAAQREQSRDGTPAVAVVLAATFGGSGTFHYLALMQRDGARLANRQTWPLGDRIQIRDLRWADQRIVIDIVRAGPNDPGCCPTEVVSLAFTPQADQPATLGAPRQLGLPELSGLRWILAESGSAPGASPITLTYEGASLRGSAGCNAYVMPVSGGNAADEVVAGVPATTRKLCEPEVMAREERFLATLQRVVRWRFDAGRLALDTGAASGATRLIFRRDP